ncbi:MAG: hypothetical protein IJH78_07675 [Clostridia bacterium]|nr:hypothetical protein [Clostridia bacterium]
MDEALSRQIDAYRFSCPGCGNALRYDIASRSMHCDSCSSNYPVWTLPDTTAEAEDNRMDVLEYVCPSCGAVLQTTQTSVTSFCSFCGSDVVLTERISRTRRPSAIVPFRITREEAEQIYRKRIKESRLAPGDLTEAETISRFRPIYIPFWKYAGHATGPASGRGTRHYSDSSYNYTEDYKYEIEGDVTVSNIIYDASSAFEDETAQHLSFSTDSSVLVPFHPGYLSGSYAEAPDTDDVIYLNEIKNYIQDKFSSEISRNAKSIPVMSLPPNIQVDSELILLPVWLLASRRNDRVLYTAINGQSGDIVCDTPVSRGRFAGLTALLFAAICALLILLSFVITLRPNFVLGICGLLAALGMRQVVPALDGILLRRVTETDPTRKMKARYKGGADRPVTERKEPAGASDKSYAGLIFGIGFVVLMLLGFLIAQIGWSSFVALLVSDHGILPPAMLIAGLVFLGGTSYDYWERRYEWKEKKVDPIDAILLKVMRVLLGAGIAVALLPIPAKQIWCYGFTFAILALVITVLLRVNQLQSEYVSRPVPFFGEEEKA